MPGSQAQIDPDQPTLKERKGLRFRAQVLFILGVFGWLAFGNVFAVAWAIGGAAPGCRWSLHFAPECEKLDVAALVGLLIGVLSLYRVVHWVATFMRTPLFLNDGEVDEPCYAQNAGEHHMAMNKLQSKRMGMAVVCIELIVTIVPLNPMWYLVSIVPAMNAAVGTLQFYLKM